MKIHKSIPALLLCAALLALGAALPWVVSQIQEQRLSGAVSYGEISNVNLELSGEDPLLILRFAQSNARISIDASSASKTEEEITRAFWDSLTELFPTDEGILLRLPEDAAAQFASEISATPYLYYDPYMHSRIIWEISPSSAHPHWASIYALVDDEAGCLILGNLTCYYFNYISLYGQDEELIRNSFFPDFISRYCAALSLPFPDDYYTTVESDEATLNMMWQSQEQPLNLKLRFWTTHMWMDISVS